MGAPVAPPSKQPGPLAAGRSLGGVTPGATQQTPNLMNSPFSTDGGFGTQPSAQPVGNVASVLQSLQGLAQPVLRQPVPPVQQPMQQQPQAIPQQQPVQRYMPPQNQPRMDQNRTREDEIRREGRMRMVRSLVGRGWD